MPISMIVHFKGKGNAKGVREQGTGEGIPEARGGNSWKWGTEKGKVYAGLAHRPERMT